jgi:hypothetical protein
MTHNEIIQDFLECTRSLDKAITDAGGSKLDIDDLERMTALELISLICTNGIRFHVKQTVSAKVLKKTDLIIESCRT